MHTSLVQVDINYIIHAFDIMQSVDKCTAVQKKVQGSLLFVTYTIIQGIISVCDK